MQQTTSVLKPCPVTSWAVSTGPRWASSGISEPQAHPTLSNPVQPSFFSSLVLKLGAVLMSQFNRRVKLYGGGVLMSQSNRLLFVV